MTKDQLLLVAEDDYEKEQEEPEEEALEPTEEEIEEAEEEVEEKEEPILPEIKKNSPLYLGDIRELW